MMDGREIMELAGEIIEPPAGDFGALL